MERKKAEYISAKGELSLIFIYLLERIVRIRAKWDSSIIQMQPYLLKVAGHFDTNCPSPAPLGEGGEFRLVQASLANAMFNGRLGHGSRG